MMSFLIALLSGAILPLAFAPFNVYTLAFISPAILFFLWLNASPLKAFVIGLFFGLGFFGVGTSWIYISIHIYATTIASVLLTIFFLITLALFPATQGYIVRKFFRKRSDCIQCLCILPASWVLWEWFRSHFLTGFPWLFLGTSQLNTPLHGFAPIVGTYGLSLIITWISGCLALLARPNTTKVKSWCVIIICGLVIIGWACSQHQWTKPMGEPFQVSLIQGNVPQQTKWDQKSLLDILEKYKTLTEKNWGSELIVWPEAAIPIFQDQAKPYIQFMDAEIKKHNAYWLFGIPIFDQKTNRYFNGVVLMGKGSGQYLKRHIVPFGEFIPAPWLFTPIGKYFQIPMSDFSPGTWNQPAIKINDIAVAPFICYEIGFPGEVLKGVKNQNLIINFVDDSWFDHSIALSQHLEMSRMRALETGRYILQSTNTGITAIIDPLGKIIAVAPPNQDYVLTGKVTAMQGNTPLMIWYYFPTFIIVIILFLLGILPRRNQ